MPAISQTNTAPQEAEKNPEQQGESPEDKKLSLEREIRAADELLPPLEKTISDESMEKLVTKLQQLHEVLGNEGLPEEEMNRIAETEVMRAQEAINLTQERADSAKKELEALGGKQESEQKF